MSPLKKNCGLVLIQEVDHNFSKDFQEKLSSLQKIIFALFKLPDTSLINILLCSKEKSRNLNYQFRKKNYPTDVLSFDYKEEKSNILAEFPWGEIVICFDICKKQALENGWNFDIEFFRLMLHGLLHLGGYDHSTKEKEKKMLTKEKEILKNCNLDFIYP